MIRRAFLMKIVDEEKEEEKTAEEIEKELAAKVKLKQKKAARRKCAKCPYGCPWSTTNKYKKVLSAYLCYPFVLGDWEKGREQEYMCTMSTWQRVPTDLQSSTTTKTSTRRLTKFWRDTRNWKPRQRKRPLLLCVLTAANLKRAKTWSISWGVRAKILTTRPSWKPFSFLCKSRVELPYYQL